MSRPRQEAAKNLLLVCSGQLQSEICCPTGAETGAASPAGKVGTSPEPGKANRVFPRYKNNWRIQTTSGIGEGG